MAYNFREYNMDQQYLLPPSIRDWVPEDSAAHFIDALVERLHERGKLSSLFEKYRSDGWGRAAYHPLLMLKVLLYAYCMGITSSRKIARTLESDVCFRFLSANQCPDFRTISEFRHKHLESFEELFVHVLDVCQQAGMADLGCIALDGRRVHGNANRKRSRPKEVLQAEREALGAVVREVLKKAEETDRAEDELYKDRRGDELPKDLRSAKGRMKRLDECLDQLEERERKEQEEYQEKLERHAERKKKTGRGGRKPFPPQELKERRRGVANPTDPDSRLMKMEAGYWVQGYNGQAAADCDSQVIVAHGITNQTNDVNQLEPMLERIQQQSGRVPEKLVADSGYFSESNLARCEGKTELFVPGVKRWKPSKEDKPPRGRIPKSATKRDLMQRKMATKRGKEIYKRRGGTIEAVFGQMWSRGLTRFWLRGAKKVAAEWSLWCLTHNLLKLHRRELRLA